MKGKPPLGLRPKMFADIDRLNEVESAIRRYQKEDWPYPMAWWTEYVKLLNKIYP